jgi:hypothetical protein
MTARMLPPATRLGECVITENTFGVYLSFGGGSGISLDDPAEARAIAAKITQAADLLDAQAEARAVRDYALAAAGDAPQAVA